MTALSDSTALEDLEDPSAFPVLGIDEDAERGRRLFREGLGRGDRSPGRGEGFSCTLGLNRTMTWVDKDLVY